MKSPKRNFFLNNFFYLLFYPFFLFNSKLKVETERVRERETEIGYRMIFNVVSLLFFVHKTEKQQILQKLIILPWLLEPVAGKIY